MVSKIQILTTSFIVYYDNSQKTSTIAKEYNPDLLNEWFDAFIKQNSYFQFLSFKDELLEAKNHPEWFLKLLNFSTANQNTL